jgi:hypothetical protein
MLKACLTNPEESAQFEKYMASKYAFENVRFMQDVLAFNQVRKIQSHHTTFF